MSFNNTKGTASIIFNGETIEMVNKNQVQVFGIKMAIMNYVGKAMTLY